MRTWLAGETAACATPAYVRDNIHVSLLARSYAHFASKLPDEGLACLNPSGYVETQGAFAQRVAAAMRPRLELDCHVELANQTAFPEPRVRINTDLPDTEGSSWSETDAWDEMARCASS